MSVLDLQRQDISYTERESAVQSAVLRTPNSGIERQKSLKKQQTLNSRSRSTRRLLASADKESHFRPEKHQKPLHDFINRNKDDENQVSARKELVRRQLQRDAEAAERERLLRQYE